LEHVPVNAGKLLERTAAIFDALEAAGARPILIGGLAVHLHATRMGTIDDELPGDHAENLARISLETSDIDIAVFAAEAIQPAIETELGKLGYKTRRNHPFLFDGVDIVPCVEGTEAVVRRFRLLPLPPDGTIRAQVGRRTIELADRGPLILLKAIAWSDRFKPKDLADVALLAIEDRLAGRDAHGFLARLMGDAAFAHHRELAAVRAEFENVDSRGSRAFARSVKNLVATPGSIDEDSEERLASIASDAVRLLLAEPLD
jgi:hypothetical protein